MRDELGTDPMPETIALYESILDAAGSHGAPAGDLAEEPGYRMAARALPFVGRQEQLETLRTAWSRAARGLGGTVLIGGEAGVGKTRLADALAAIVSAEGGRVLWGETGAVEAAPYQAFRDALRSGIRLLDDGGLDTVWLSCAAALVPQLRARRPDLPPPPRIEPEHEQSRVFETFARTFEAIARPRPTLLVLEDLHWAGAATISLLEHVVRVLAGRPILIVGTYREEEIARDHPLRAFRRRASHERLTKALALGPLAWDAIEQIVDPRLTETLAAPERTALMRRLFLQSGGNPLFLGELLRNYDEGDAADPHIPATIERTIAARLERLSARTVAVAEFAAIIGAGFDRELLVAAGGWPEADVEAALGELVDRHIVREAGFDASDYAFSHFLIQSTVYARIRPADARRRHRRIAEVMSELYADRSREVAAQLALHFDRGGDNNAASAHYLEAARAALSVFANEEAVAYATRGLELASDDSLCIALLFAREEGRRRLADREGQTADLDAAERRVPASDHANQRVLIKRRIALARAVGDRNAEESQVAALHGLAETASDPAIAADALLADAAYHTSRGDLAEAQRLLLEALRLAEQLGDVPAQLEAHVGLIQCSRDQARPADAHRLLASAFALAERHGDLQMRRVVVKTALRVQAMAYDLDGMLDSAKEALRLAIAVGDAEAIANAHANLGSVYVIRFDVARAREHLAFAEAFYERHRHLASLALVLYYQGTLLCMLGRFDEGFAMLRRSEELDIPLFDTVSATCARAYFLNLCGRSAEARDVLLDLLHRLESAPLFSTRPVTAILGAVQRALGAFDQAIATLERATAALRRDTPDDKYNFCSEMAELALSYLDAGDVQRAQTACAEFVPRLIERADDALLPHYSFLIASRCARASGAVRDADDFLARAEAERDRMLALIPDEESRASFLATDINREIAAARRRADPSNLARPR